MLRKANQKRSLDDIVIQKGEFDWRSLFGDENALTKALGEFEDTEDAHAAEVAAREEVDMEGADEADFGAIEPTTPIEPGTGGGSEKPSGGATPVDVDVETVEHGDVEEEGEEEQEEEEEGGTTIDYILAFVQSDPSFFAEWKV